MFYMNEDGIILIHEKSWHFVDFETRELESCKYKLKITSDEWLESNNYKFIGNL